MASENLRDSLNLVITGIVIFLLLGVMGMWAYNFMAQSDAKMFDDNNKYIDATLTNPDVEGNYKEIYLNKSKTDNIFMSFLKFFSTLKGILVIAFSFLLLIMLIIKNRQTAIEHLKKMFD